MLEYSFMILIPILINMALLTLLERKMLGFSQLRLGPNKVGAVGAIQPVSDALKLFSNENMYIGSGVKDLYYSAPIMSLSLSLLFSSILPTYVGVISWEYMYLMVMLIFSLGVYPILLAGWSSNSKYAMVGSMRGVAQTISYEISMAFILMSIFLILGPFSNYMLNSVKSMGSVWFIPLIFVWAIVSLAELNRTPFDLSEGESELVSGFNTEYSSSKFALVFMGEYVSILVLSSLTSVLFLGTGPLMSFAVGVVFAGVTVWVRATLPRVRYDVLMSVSWKSLLPLSIGFVLVSSVFSV